MRNREEGDIKMDNDKIKVKFLEAFSELENELRITKQELTEILECFIENEKKRVNDKKTLYLINSPESRIKNIDHFWSKLLRNGYIEKWNPTEDTDYKMLLRENLSDLIGLRLLCYFEIDENEIFENLEDFLNSNSSFSCLKVDTVDKVITGTISKDHIYINKIQGQFKNSKSENYCFEIQIKSLANDLWGEVDHEIIYKAKQYQYDSESTKEFSTNIHKNLIASDHQLYELLRRKYEEDQLVNSLFFLKTEKLAFGKEKRDNINHIYHQFFNFFNGECDKWKIKLFVGKSLIDPSRDFELSVPENINNALITFFSENILNHYFSDDLEDVEKIACNIYVFNSKQEFLVYITKNLFQDYLDLLRTQAKEEIEDSDEEYDKEYVDAQLRTLPSIKDNKSLLDRYSHIFLGIKELSDFKHFSPTEQNQIQFAYIKLVQNFTKETSK